MECQLKFVYLNRIRVLASVPNLCVYRVRVIRRRYDFTQILLHERRFLNILKERVAHSSLLNGIMYWIVFALCFFFCGYLTAPTSLSSPSSSSSSSASTDTGISTDYQQQPRDDDGDIIPYDAPDIDSEQLRGRYDARQLSENISGYRYSAADEEATSCRNANVKYVHGQKARKSYSN